MDRLLDDADSVVRQAVKVVDKLVDLALALDAIHNVARFRTTVSDRAPLVNVTLSPL